MTTNSRRGFFRNTAAIAGALGMSGLVSGCGGAANAATTSGELSNRLKSLTGNTVWTKVGETKLQFQAYHPQGMVKIGDVFFMSTVEIIVPTVKFPQPVGGYDRDTGVGKGHVLKFDAQGKLLADIEVGEGTMYHPGGIDYDGRNIWVPTAEYRPNSQALVYQLNPTTNQVTKLFGYQDHLGGLSRNTDDNSLHAVTWGSRRFYRFGLDLSQTRSPDALVPPEQLRRTNHAFYIDYQDNQYLGNNEMLYTGLNNYRVSPTSPQIALGGLEIVNLETGLPVHQVPVKLWSPASGRAMTNNPSWFELTATGVRGYFVPDDDASVSMYIYEAS